MSPSSDRDRTRRTRRRIAGGRQRATRPGVRPPAPAVPEAPAEGHAPAEETAVPAERDTPTSAEESSPRNPAAPAESAPPPAARSDDETRPSDDEACPAGPDRRTPAWLLVVLAVLVAGVVALDVWLVVRYQDRQQAQDDLQGALVQAPSVAEDAAAAVLSYQWNEIDKTTAAAERYLSDGFLPKYNQTVKDVVVGPSSDVKATVRAEVLGSGVIDAGANRCEVLLFVNQTTKKAKSEPEIAQDRVIFVMIKVDDRWVVDDIRLV